jgi:hypothetical protein
MTYICVSQPHSLRHPQAVRNADVLSYTYIHTYIHTYKHGCRQDGFRVVAVGFPFGGKCAYNLKLIMILGTDRPRIFKLE